MARSYAYNPDTFRNVTRHAEAREIAIGVIKGAIEQEPGALPLHEVMFGLKGKGLTVEVAQTAMFQLIERGDVDTDNVGSIVYPPTPK